MAVEGGALMLTLSAILAFLVAFMLAKWALARYGPLASVA